MLKLLNNKSLRLIGSLLLVIGSYFLVIEIEKSKNADFKINSFETTAEIIDYQIKGAGAGLDHIITFEYIVNNIKYKKSINTSIRFTRCYKTRSCIGRKFKVYYKPKDPNNVRIDFDQPIF